MAMKYMFEFRLSDKGLEDFLGVWSVPSGEKLDKKVPEGVLNAMRVGADSISSTEESRTYTLKGKEARIEKHEAIVRLTYSSYDWSFD